MNILTLTARYFVAQALRLLTLSVRVDDDTLADRLLKCEGCMRRFSLLNQMGPVDQGDICMVCGCFILDKAALPLSQCPDKPQLWKSIGIKMTLRLSINKAQDVIYLLYRSVKHGIGIRS